MNTYYWCFKCERAFTKDGVYGGKKVQPGKRGGFECPFCGASAMDTLDWESFIFGLAAANNYPEQPFDGCCYPLYPNR